MKQNLPMCLKPASILLRVFSYLVLFVFPQLSMASQPGEDLHREIATVLKGEGLTGAVWATINPKSGTKINAAGVKNVNTGEKLSASDRVHIGSVTKTLVAVGVLRLVTQGKLKLETPVSELLPETILDNPWAATDPVRVRHLLDHTAGLDDARLWQVFSLKPKGDTPMAETFRAGGSLLLVRSRPGSRFSYSNISYSLLGMVIESLTGERYESYLDRELLKPLAMHDSTFDFISQLNDSRIAMGHFENGEAHYAIPGYLRTAGQFTTTANDMVLFAKFLMSNGQINGITFVAPELLRAMGEPIGTEAANAGLKVGYSLGLFKRDRNGLLGRCHGGDTSGYHAMFCIFPEQHSAFFVSTNTGSEVADYNAIDKLLANSLRLEQLLPALPVPTDGIKSEKWSGFYTPEPNRMSSFSYIDTLLGFATLSSEGDRMRLKPFQSKELLLTPVGNNLFRVADRLTASHALLTSQEGKKVISTGSQSLQKASLWKLVPLWTSLVFGLLGLIYVLLCGLSRIIMIRLKLSNLMLVPFLGTLLLALPLPLFYRQSFMEIGDLTFASGILAMVTAILPITMMIGLWRYLRIRPVGKIAVMDCLAMIAVLQWTIVLAVWGLLPLRLWA
jgi:CubicO group peptidase (beta-lactamase class C family)